MITPETLRASGFDGQVLLNNFRALYRIDMTLAQKLDDLPACEHLVVERAKSGRLTAKVKLGERELFLHSRYDPVAEAEKLVDRLNLDENFVFIISGFGLGYPVRELFDRTSDQTIVVVLEPDQHVIRAALSNLDFSAELSSRRLILIDKLDKGLLHRKLTEPSATMTLGTELVTHPYTNQWNADFHRQMRSFVTDYVAYCRMSFVTLISNCRITQQNVANNLAPYHCCPPIDTLKGRFAGYPAIVVSAGPSLAKNIELLREAKGKAVIIAVQTTLKPLLGLGIEPDFVTSLDYHEISRRFFEGIDDFGNIHLVAEPKVTWHVLDTFKGRVSLLKNEFADLCLGPATRRRDSLTAGSTVAHLAFYLAEYIGANPIILTGQDLGFSDNMYYAPGTAVHDIWSVELNRFNTLEMKEWERILRHQPILRKIEDIHGRPIYTDEQMFTYLQQFERDFAECTATVIDATEGGAKKMGTTLMTLREALDTYAQRKIESRQFDYLHELNWFDPARLGEIADQLKQRMADAAKLKEFSEQTVKLLRQLQELTDRPKEFNRLIVKIDEIRSMVNTHSRTLNMVCAVSALAELRRYRHDRMLGADPVKGAERAKRQLARDVEYVEAVVRGCDELKGVLTDALLRVEQYSDKHNHDAVVKH